MSPCTYLFCVFFLHTLHSSSIDPAALPSSRCLSGTRVIFSFYLAYVLSVPSCLHCIYLHFKYINYNMILKNPPAKKILERKITSWKDGSQRLVEALKGSSAGVSSSLGVKSSISADIIRQEGGKMSSPKSNEKQKSSVQRRFEKRELTL